MSHFLDRYFEKIENEGWFSDELISREATVYGLLCWRFPNIDHIVIVRALRENPEGTWQDDDLAIVIKWRDVLAINRYAQELEELPTQDLFAFYRQESKARNIEIEEDPRSLDQNRGWFFDQPDAQADFEYWSKAEYWTSDEAVAISFGKNPKVVTGEALKNYLGKAQFADNYFLRCDLLDRAIQSDRLPKEIPPADFLEWVHQRSIPIPSALTNCLAGLGTISSHAWDGFDPDSSTYPAELDIAFQAWRATSTRPDSSKTPKEQINVWVREHYPETSKEAQQRIAIMCNWAPRGGRPSR